MRLTSAIVLALGLIVGSWILVQSPSRGQTTGSGIGAIPGLRVADIPLERAFSAALLMGPNVPVAPAQNAPFAGSGTYASVRYLDAEIHETKALVITSMGGQGDFSLAVNGTTVAVTVATSLSALPNSFGSTFQPILIRPGDHVRAEWLGIGTMQGFLLNANEILP